MKKRFGLIAALLAVTALVGCAKEPTVEEYQKWAEENGYELKDPALPSARLEGKTTYNTADSGIQIAPAADSGAKKLADYLDREDCVYIDLRDASSYSQGHIEGFEWVPHFDIIMKSGGARADQLFYKDGDTIKPNYEESVAVLNALFPKDKVLILMCQSGGRVVNTMDVLAANGYDMSKVYNVGGFGQVKGEVADWYNVTAGKPVKVTATYDFSGFTKKA